MVPDAYDFWLFDLDGTVVDADPAYTREVFDRVGDRIGRAFTDREVAVLWHGLGGPRNRKLREWGIDPDPFWSEFHDVEDPQARAAATHLHPDAAALVAELDAPVGLVTHCQSQLTDPVLERLDIRDWFDAVVCCTDDLGWKPDPGPVEHAIRQLGMGGTRGVLAGDGDGDVGAAWNAGLDAVHVERHGPDRRGHCVLGDYRVETFDELPRSQ
ncbi:MAG: HAD family hydrolase [Haloferacaceae archaeon]